MNRHRRKCRWQRMEWSNFRRHHLGTGGEASYDTWMKRTRRWEEKHTIDNRRPPAISSICIWSYQGYKNSNKLIIIERLWYLVYTFGQTKDARIRRCKGNHTNGCKDSALRGKTHYSRSTASRNLFNWICKSSGRWEENHITATDTQTNDHRTPVVSSL